MPKSTRKLIQTCKLICTILLVLVVAAQFLPYWYGEYTETKSFLLTEEEYNAKAEEYARRATETAPTTEPTTAPEPETNPDGSTKPTIDLGIEFYTPPSENEKLPTLTKYSIAKYVWMFNMNHTNDIIYMPVLVLVFAIASIVTYVKNSYSFLCSAFGVVAPAVGVFGFLTVDFYATGAFPYSYYLNIAINAIALVAFVITLVIQIVAFIKVIKKERAEKRAKSSFANQ